jgi:hypothetical protein
MKAVSVVLTIQTLRAAPSRAKAQMATADDRVPEARTAALRCSRRRLDARIPGPTPKGKTSERAGECGEYSDEQAAHALAPLAISGRVERVPREQSGACTRAKKRLKPFEL